MQATRAAGKKSRIGSAIIGCLAVAFFAYALFYLTYSTTSGDDIVEGNEIITLVTSTHSIPESVSSPGRPAVFCDVEVKGFFLRRFGHVRIYGITDKMQQDSIVRSLDSHNKASKGRQLVVGFYEKENWKTWSDSATGNRGGERGPETPIREVLVR